MRNKKLLVLLTTLMFFSSPVLVLAIGRLSDEVCINERFSYLKLWNGEAQSGEAMGVCFGGINGMSIKVYKVYEVTTGKYYVRFTADGEYYPAETSYYCPYQRVTPFATNVWTTVTRVTIRATKPSKCFNGSSGYSIIEG